MMEGSLLRQVMECPFEVDGRVMWLRMSSRLRTLREERASWEWMPVARERRARERD
jgi:hypothetical protein